MSNNNKAGRHKSRKRFNQKRTNGRHQRGPKDSERYTVIDHAPVASLITSALPVLCKAMGVPKESILRFIGDEANRYTDKHRVSLERHSDIVDELQEHENDHKSDKRKLKAQEPEQLIEEGRIQPIHLAGLAASGTMFVLSFTATVVATSTQVQQHSDGSLAYAVSVGLIAATGSSLLKWSTLYPFADYKRQVEMLFVPIAFGFFGLFVYQLTDLYFYAEPIVVESSNVPDFSKFLAEGEAVADSTETETEAPSLISLKWFYIGVLGTEMFASYAFLSFIETCSTLQLKPIVRAIRALGKRALAPRHRNRVTMRKSREQSAWLQYQSKMSQVPGKALQEFIERFFK